MPPADRDYLQLRGTGDVLTLAACPGPPGRGAPCARDAGTVWGSRANHLLRVYLSVRVAIINAGEG
jgi:hypothetical protein